MAKERKQFALHDLKDVLRALEELGFPCTLIGGQAVYCWAGLFLSSDAALQQFSKLTDFLSKDIDFSGQRASRESDRAQTGLSGRTAGLPARFWKSHGWSYPRCRGRCALEH